MKRLTVLAMTQKGHSVVEAVHARHPDVIAAVVGARDASVAEDGYEEIKGFCRSNDIPFFDRKEHVRIDTDYALAVSWRWIVDTGSTRLIVLHDSLLPRYRGFNPLVTALINGDSRIGVTALFATEDYDTGDVIAQSESTIGYPITIAEAIEVIRENYVSVALQIARVLQEDGGFDPKPQDERQASYSLWRDEEDYFIDWTEPAEVVERMVDAVGFPYRGAASVVDGQIVRIVRAKALGDVKIGNRVCGKVIFSRDSKPVVVCGKGLLRIDELTDDEGESLLPLRRFRVRFKGFADLAP